MSPSFKIPAPNYTQSPNILFDEVFKTLKEGELRVILVIIRQTFGWHKSFDRISLSQIAEKSGLERSYACRSLKSLIQKRLVEKKKFGGAGQEKCYYRLVLEECKPQELDESDGVESQEEMDLISNSSYQCLTDTPPVSVEHWTSVCETPTKETPQKKLSKQLSVVPAGADTVKTQIQEPVIEEEAEEAPDKKADDPIPISIPVQGRYGTTVVLTETEYYATIIRKKVEWSSDAIRYAWKTLHEYSGKVYDWWAFVEGTVKKYEDKKKSDKIVNSGKPKTWKNSQQKTHPQTTKSSYDKSKERPSENASSEPLSQKSGLSLMERVRMREEARWRNGQKNPTTSC